LVLLKISPKVGVFALVLLVSAAPTMACLVPSATLTAAERACCKQMADQCGGAEMTSSHSCCQRLSGPEDNTFIKAPSAQLDHTVNVSYDVFPLPGAIALTGASPIQAHSNLDFQGPPGSPPATISILRI
jgi:hypothetical protein